MTATLAMTIVATALAPFAAAAAQAQTPDHGEALTAPLVDVSHGLTSYRLVEHWTRQASEEQAAPTANTQQPPQAADPPLVVSGVFAARVTLRLSGITLGVGDAVVVGALDDEAVRRLAHDITPMLRSATEQAITQVKQHLQDAAVQAALTQVAGENPRPRTAYADVAWSLRADVQLAHHLEPVQAPADNDATTVAARFAPGYHGLVMRPGAAVSRDAANAGVAEAWMWPASALAANLTPGRQLVQLLNEVGLQPQDLTRVGKPGGVPLWRFEALHIVRPEMAPQPRDLVRGNALLPPVSVGGPALASLSEQLALHLEQRINDEGGMAGAYLPTSGQYHPLTADDNERALAFYALVHAAGRRLARATGEDTYADLLAHKVTRFAAHLADDLTARHARDAQTTPAQLMPAAALVAMTLAESPRSAEFKAQRDQMTAILTGQLQRPADAAAAPPDALPAPTQALRLAALMSVYELTREPGLIDAARRELGPLWEKQGAQMTVTALPWMAAAQLRLIRLSDDRDLPPAVRTAQQRFLADIVDRLCATQIAEPPPVGPADVVGGFLRSPLHDGQAPSPGWDTALLLQFIAPLVRDDGVVAGRDRIGWLLTCGLAARFLDQLTMDGPSCYYVRSLADARGGVRVSLTNNTLPVSATALALLAVTELQLTLDTFDVPANVTPGTQALDQVLNQPIPIPAQK